MDAPAPVFERLLTAYARYFPCRRGKLRLVDLFWRAAAGKNGLIRTARLKYGGFSMACDLSQMLQRQFYFFGTYFIEEELLACWSRLAKDANIIFDVGANAGIYGLSALAAQPRAVVHAFEPTPETAAHLRGTAALNRLENLCVHEAAVSGKNGLAWLRRFRGETGANEGMNFISEETGGAGAERVGTVSLDDFCREHSIGRIDLLKIDVQGHELSVLEGANGLLKEGRVGFVFMELNWSINGSAGPAAASIALLERSGFRFSAPGARLDWKRSGLWMKALTDVVARKFTEKGSENVQ